MAEWSRRQFVKGAVAATAIAGGAVAVERLMSTPGTPLAVQGQTFEAPWEAMRKDLVQTFHYLNVPRETMDSFLEALSSHAMTPDAPRVRELFLLSSDFFAHGEDEARPLGFQTLYDAYLSPCYNPFTPAA